MSEDIVEQCGRVGVGAFQKYPHPLPIAIRISKWRGVGNEFFYRPRLCGSLRDLVR